MFFVNFCLIAVGFTLYLFYDRIGINDETESNDENKYEDAMAEKIKETREMFEWILENRRNEPVIQTLLKNLRKLGMTEKEFCEIIPAMKYEVSDELYESVKKSDLFKEVVGLSRCGCGNTEGIKKEDFFDFFGGDKTKTKAILALMYAQERRDIEESDQEWIEESK